MSLSKLHVNMRFPEKLWKIVNECSSGAIAWAKNGDTIAINIEKFEKEYLYGVNCVFKTTNFLSFVRQLNLYDFRKCGNSNGIHEYRNQYFLQGRQDLVKLITRKPVSKSLKRTKKIRKGNKGKEKSFPATTSFKSRSNIGSSTATTENVYPLPYSMWKNFSPMNNMIDPLKYQLINEALSSGGEKPEKGTVSIENNNGILAPSNQAVFRKIVFVPVPAYYGMFPGYYKDTSVASFSALQNERSANTSSSSQEEYFE